MEIFESLVKETPVHLVSLMDHSPGQRQYVHLDQFKVYYKGKHGLTDAEMEVFLVSQMANAAQYSQPQREAISAYCRENGLAMASHDDATLEHIEESHALGMVIAEFPTTSQAAEASHAKGMKVLMGAPNIVRGGSHSGNVAASTLARGGVLDILSSDYYPASLLHAAMMLTEEGYTLPQAIRTVSQHPAQAVGLHDRGEIKVGLDADLIHMRLANDAPVINQVWKRGERVF
jgi:alpha-D-ribose 1-methylphosphonate 5-triphosphate diphosphatase